MDQTVGNLQARGEMRHMCSRADDCSFDRYLARFQAAAASASPASYTSYRAPRSLPSDDSTVVDAEPRRSMDADALAKILATTLICGYAPEPVPRELRSRKRVTFARTVLMMEIPAMTTTGGRTVARSATSWRSHHVQILKTGNSSTKTPSDNRAPASSLISVADTTPRCPFARGIEEVREIPAVTRGVGDCDSETEDA